MHPEIIEEISSITIYNLIAYGSVGGIRLGGLGILIPTLTYGNVKRKSDSVGNRETTQDNGAETDNCFINSRAGKLVQSVSRA
ncbi:hypothetical protein TNCV_411821 [Trichonephila clavipes]|nr:hypothetical protein TNCV_411821 [Trichonephila clavipes]